MLARYKIHRGKPPAGQTLPVGIRQDTRKHTRHCLRPTTEMVEAYLAGPNAETWNAFSRDYRQLLESRFAEDREPFDALAELAKSNDVHLGCSCPTAKNPDVAHCHTVLALRFLRERYPELVVEFPE